jgi:hypothetical protein
VKRLLVLTLALGLLGPPPSCGQCPGGVCPSPDDGYYQPVFPQRPSRGSDAVPVPPALVAASVKIVFQGEGGTTCGGSGTIIKVGAGRAYVLTNRHVCPRAGRIVVHVRGRALPARWLEVDEKGADLAMLEIADPGVPPVAVAQVQPAAQEPVWQVGYGSDEQGQRLRQRAGRVLGYRSTSADRRHWNLHLDLACLSGDSGSGIFAQQSQQLIAVLWGGNGRETVCVGLQDIRRFCDACWRRHGPRPGGGGISIQVPAPSPPEPGPPGPQGPPGPPGPPGNTAVLEARIQALENQLANLRGSIRVRVNASPKE